MRLPIQSEPVVRRTRLLRHAMQGHGIDPAQYDDLDDVDLEDDLDDEVDEV